MQPNGKSNESGIRSLRSYPFLPLVSCLCELGKLVLPFCTSGNLSVGWSNNTVLSLTKLLTSGSRVIVLERTQVFQDQIQGLDPSYDAPQLCGPAQGPEPWVILLLWIRLTTSSSVDQTDDINLKKDEMPTSKMPGTYLVDTQEMIIPFSLSLPISEFILR